MVFLHLVLCFFCFFFLSLLAFHKILFIQVDLLLALLDLNPHPLDLLATSSLTIVSMTHSFATSLLNTSSWQTFIFILFTHFCSLAYRMNFSLLKVSLNFTSHVTSKLITSQTIILMVILSALQSLWVKPYHSRLLPISFSIASTMAFVAFNQLIHTLDNLITWTLHIATTMMHTTSLVHFQIHIAINIYVAYNISR